MNVNVNVNVNVADAGPMGREWRLGVEREDGGLDSARPRYSDELAGDCGPDRA